MNLVLILPTAAYDALAGGDVMLDCREHILVAYITRAAQTSGLWSLVFARLLMLLDLLHGVFEVNGLSDV